MDSKVLLLFMDCNVVIQLCQLGNVISSMRDIAEPQMLHS
jgi:hypothetical protein